MRLSVTQPSRRPVSSRRIQTGCPPWIRGHWSPRITAKTIGVHWFDHRANWLARVRNVSRLGSQISILERRAHPLPPSFHPGGNSSNERIDDAHASVHEIGTVSRDDRQTVDYRRRRDEAILEWHGFPGSAKPRQQFRPFQTRVHVSRQAVETTAPRVETSAPERSASFLWEG